jgi:hypothetical protein
MKPVDDHETLKEGDGLYVFGNILSSDQFAKNLLSMKQPIEPDETREIRQLTGGDGILKQLR